MPEELIAASEPPLVEVLPELSNAAEALPAEIPSEATKSEKGVRWFELCLVLLIAIGSYFFNSFYVLIVGSTGKGTSLVQSVEWMESILRESGGLLLLGYVLWRRKLRFSDLGLCWSVRDIGTGVAVAFAGYLAYGLGHSVVSVVYHALFTTPARGVTARQIYSHPSLIAFPFTILNAFFEELIVRAYLMTEIRELTGSLALAATVSVAVQTSYHLYYGWIGALSLSFLFLVFSIYYAKTRKATPLIFAHALIDLYGFMRLL